MNITIYALKNRANSKVYVGQTTVSLEKRWNRGHGYIGSSKIHSAIKKYGIDCFYYEVLAVASSQEEADCLETEHIKNNNSIIGGYNIANGGVKSVMTGRKHSLKSIKKMSQSHMGNTAHLGYPHSEETKNKLSLMNKGKSPPNKGKPLSLETKNKLSQALRNKPGNSGSFRKNNTPHNKGKITTEEIKQKISEKNFKVNKEDRIKICDLYKNTKITIRQLMEDFNCGVSSIRNTLKQNNLIGIRRKKNEI